MVTVHAPSKKAAPHRKFVDPDVTPLGVLHWPPGDHQKRQKVMSAWRRAVLAEFTKEVIPLKVAWAVYDLCSLKGYCFARDKHLAVELGVQVNKVQDGLSRLKSAGAVVVVWTKKPDHSQERRVFPAQEIMQRHAAAAGWFALGDHETTPVVRGKTTPHHRGGISSQTQPSNGREDAPLPRWSGVKTTPVVRGTEYKEGDAPRSPGLQASIVSLRFRYPKGGQTDE